MMATQYEMAEFLALVAIGKVGVSQDGRTLLDVGAGMPVPRPEMDERARRALSNGWIVEVSRRVGLTSNGRAALRTLRATTQGVVPDDAEFHRLTAEHARWVDGFLAPEQRGYAPLPSMLAPPRAERSAPVGTLMFTPRAPGPSWVVELSGLDDASLARALSPEQRFELVALLDRVRAALG